MGKNKEGKEKLKLLDIAFAKEQLDIAVASLGTYVHLSNDDKGSLKNGGDTFIQDAYFTPNEHDANQISMEISRYKKAVTLKFFDISNLNNAIGSLKYKTDKNIPHDSIRGLIGELKNYSFN